MREMKGRCVLMANVSQDNRNNDSPAPLLFGVRTADEQKASHLNIVRPIRTHYIWVSCLCIAARLTKAKHAKEGNLERKEGQGGRFEVGEVAWQCHPDQLFQLSVSLSLTVWASFLWCSGRSLPLQAPGKANILREKKVLSPPPLFQWWNPLWMPPIRHPPLILLARIISHDYS